MRSIMKSSEATSSNFDEHVSFESFIDSAWRDESFTLCSIYASPNQFSSICAKPSNTMFDVIDYYLLSSMRLEANACCVIVKQARKCGRKYKCERCPRASVKGSERKLFPLIGIKGISLLVLRCGKQRRIIKELACQTNQRQEI